MRHGAYGTAGNTFVPVILVKTNLDGTVALGGNISGSGGSYTGALAVITSAGQLQLPTTGSGAGILIGGDFQIYRSAADVGYTPDAFQVAAKLTVGTAADATRTLFVSETFSSALSAGHGTVRAAATLTGGGPAGTFLSGVAGNITCNSGASTANYLAGIIGGVTLSSTQTGLVTAMYAFDALVDANGVAASAATVVVTNAYGMRTGARMNTVGALGTISTAHGIHITSVHTSTGGIVTTNKGLLVSFKPPGGGTTTNYGILIEDPASGGGAITTNYGVYIGDQSLGSTNYALYFAGTSGLARQGIWWNGDTNLYRSAANVLATDDKLYVALELEVDGALNHDGTTVGFYGVAPTTRAAAYTPTNVVADRAYDANATTVDELADVVGTLIADLQLLGLVA